jgi:hypothetical protein
VQATDDAGKAKAAWLTAVQVARDSRARLDPILKGLTHFVMLEVGDTQASSEKLAAFGYTPRKPRTVDPATQVAAAEKARATRKPRHTMGPKQKRKVVAEG